MTRITNNLCSIVCFAIFMNLTPGDYAIWVDGKLVDRQYSSGELQSPVPPDAHRIQYWSNGLLVDEHGNVLPSDMHVVQLRQEHRAAVENWGLYK